jgi:hypothetical protein
MYIYSSGMQRRVQDEENRSSSLKHCSFLHNKAEYSPEVHVDCPSIHQLTGQLKDHDPFPTEV